MTPGHYSAEVIIILYTGLANEVVPLTGDVRARLSPGLKEQLFKPVLSYDEVTSLC